jgi:hypothetical protein
MRRFGIRQDVMQHRAKWIRLALEHTTEWHGGKLWQLGSGGEYIAHNHHDRKQSDDEKHTHFLSIHGFPPGNVEIELTYDHDMLPSVRLLALSAIN